MKERVLSLGVKGCVESFSSIKWKFFEVREDRVRVEVPRGLDESFVVELPYSNETQLAEVTKTLRAGDFIEQKVRVVCDW